MKKLMKSSVVLVALVFSAALMTGCVASAQPGVVVASGPAYYPPPHGYRPRPYYHRPSRVVVVERQPVIVRPYRQRPVVVRPRSGYYRHDARQPRHDGRHYGRDRGRIR